MSAGRQDLALLRQALQQGRRDDALALCRRLQGPLAAVAEFHSLHGFALLASGQAEAAEKALRRALTLQPRAPDVLHTLGHALRLQGRWEEALAAWQAALKLQPRLSEAASDLGAALVALGRNADAIPWLEQAVQGRPQNADSWNNLGVALRNLGRLPAAKKAFTQAVAVAPRHAEARCSLGHLAKLERDFSAAAEHYLHAFQLAPALTEALLGLADCLRESGRGEEAVAAYRGFLQAHPDHAEAWDHLGLALLSLGRKDEALDALRRTTALAPQRAAGWTHLATTYLEANRPVDGLAAARNASPLAPDDADLANTVGLLHLRLGAPADALEALRRACALEPTRAAFHNNLASALHAHGAHEDAIATARRALALQPDFPAARFNLAAMLLLTGQEEEGWQAYEHRAVAHLRTFPFPRWDGRTDVTGKRVLVHAEQGLGDTLQFLRYLPLLVARGARVWAEIQPALRAIVPEGHPAITWLSAGDPLPAVDFHVPLLSLPYSLHTYKAPPLASEAWRVPQDIAQRWAERLSATPLPRIGLVWSGNPAHTNDHNRSIPWDTFRQILTFSPATFLALQKEVAAADCPLVNAAPVRQIGPDLQSFADTAAVCRQCDLVITVDTSVAHLAGSLDRPTWLLLPFTPDWRWGLGRDDTPWYPSVRLFRQPHPGQWSAVLTHVLDALSRTFPQLG